MKIECPACKSNSWWLADHDLDWKNGKHYHFAVCESCDCPFDICITLSPDNVEVEEAPNEG